MTVNIKELSKTSLVINNQYKLNIYTDGYTVSDICFINLENGKYIIEDKCLPYVIDVSEKISRSIKNIEKIKNEVIKILINKKLILTD